MQLDIISDAASFQDQYNAAVQGMSSLLRHNRESKTKQSNTSWRSLGFRGKQSNQQFEPGTANFSPGYYMQRHEVSSN
jgi:hypothetical protein